MHDNNRRDSRSIVMCTIMTTATKVWIKLGFTASKNMQTYYLVLKTKHLDSSAIFAVFMD